MTMLGEGAGNATRWAIVAALCATGLGAYLLGKLVGFAQQRKVCRDTPPWALLLLLGSYALLVPGLVFDIFHYGVWAMDGGLELQTSAENMSGFAAELMAAGGWYGSIAVIVYAMVIPGVKLVLFAIAQVLRRGRPEQVRHARRCIITLQVISKWASPDMFAYILMIYLIRGLNHPPLLVSDGHLDFGFTCFSLFCIFSTVATLGIRVPPKPSSGRQIAAVHQQPFGSINMGLFVAAVLFVLFFVNFVLGVITPCMALRLNMDLLYTPTGPIDIMLKPFVDELNLPAIANSNVSLWSCMVELWQWTLLGYANGFLAFVLYAVFVIGFTILDMIALLIIAVRCTYHFAQPKVYEAPRKLVAFSSLLKKMSMLDVAVVGVTLVVACGQVYKSQGCNLSYLWGLLALFLAEVCHYAMYHAVHRMVPPAAEDGDLMVKPAAVYIGKSMAPSKSMESGEATTTEPEGQSEVDTQCDTNAETATTAADSAV